MSAEEFFSSQLYPKLTHGIFPEAQRRFEQEAVALAGRLTKLK